MTPVMLGGIATAAGGLLLVGVGVAVGRWWNRRDWVAHRVYTAMLEVDLATAEREREQLAAEVRWLRGQVTEAVRIIDDLTDQRLADAAGVEPFPTRVQVPPQVWAALQEAREKPEVN